MILRISDDNIIDRIIIDGDLNLSVAPDLLAALNETMEDKDILIDISGVVSMDFAGLQLLAAAFQHYRRKDRLLALSPAPPACEEVMALAGLKAFFYGADWKAFDGKDGNGETA